MESFGEFMTKLENRIASKPIETNPVLESKFTEDELTVFEDSYYEENSYPKKSEKITESSIPVIEETVSGYKIYRDKSEKFVCDMQISGANPANSKARIIIESTDMTYMFEGSIDGKGHCEIPLRKMNFLSENEIGKIKLEVIADDMVFNPWEDTFVATSSKKVIVKVAESVDSAPKVGIRISNIR